MGQSVIKNPRKVFSQQGGGGGGTIDGSLTANEIVYGVDSNTIGSLTVATYPNLTELSYLKGVNAALQTQLNRLPFFIAGHANTSPVDSTTYGIGCYYSNVMQAGGATGIGSSWKFPYAKTITKIVVITRYAVAGSNEASPIVLRNQTTTTDNTIGNLDYSLSSYASSGTFVQEFTVSIAVNDTDYYFLKEVTPAWGTNPTNVGKTIYFY